MFDNMSPEFLADFRAWRAGRPAWKKLLAQIRAGTQTRGEGDALRAAAADAGADAQELADLQHIMRHATKCRRLAAEFPTAQRRLAELDSEVARLKQVVQSAARTEVGRAVAALAEAQETRRRFWFGTFLDCQQGRDYIERVAAPMGLG